VLAGLRGEEPLAEFCRREGIVRGMYYKWSKGSLIPLHMGMAGLHLEAVLHQTTPGKLVEKVAVNARDGEPDLPLCHGRYAQRVIAIGKWNCAVADTHSPKEPAGHPSAHSGLGARSLFSVVMEQRWRELLSQVMTAPANSQHMWLDSDASSTFGVCGAVVASVLARGFAAMAGPVRVTLLPAEECGASPRACSI
jgi:hypothetical protein